MIQPSYVYTNTWFKDSAQELWNVLIPEINPTTILEIGSFEGASTCYLIEKLGAIKDIELHCVDTWEGGVEHGLSGEFECDMTEVEQRFVRNTAIATNNVRHRVSLQIHKQSSVTALTKLINDQKQEYFDFIYVDGSHQASDVLLDALLGFRLLKKGGVIAFDDYLWSENLPGGIDPLRCPKVAIDAFTNIYCRKIRVLSAPLYQLYVQKITN